MNRMLWPRTMYWLGFATTLFGLFYALTGITASTAVLARSSTQTGGAGLAIIGVALMMTGKAWMDALARSRGRLSCPSCSRVVQATHAHCAQCGAPLRTNVQMLRVLDAAAASSGAPRPLYCPGCGSQATTAASFCSHCGRSLSRAHTPVAA
jgi:predicted amidophosphoribosyltransferase